MKTRTLTIVILLLGVTGIARADHDDDGRKSARAPRKRSFSSRESRAVQAPEIDPASMVVALTLVGDALAVLRGRRSIKASR